jgi:hypothetical protein
VKDDESELRPYPRKDVIAGAAIPHGIDKETTSLRNFRGPVLLNQKLPLDRTCRRNPDMLLSSLIPIENSVVA